MPGALDFGRISFWGGRPAATWTYLLLTACFVLGGRGPAVHAQDEPCTGFSAVTPSSLKAAYDALHAVLPPPPTNLRIIGDSDSGSASGGDRIEVSRTQHVRLDSGGCVEYSREIEGGRITREKLFVDKKPVLSWEHTTETQSVGEGRETHSGVSTWRSTVTRGPLPKDEQVEITRYSPSTGTLTRRETYTRVRDTIKARWEAVNEQ
jgi:hypothetical protein